MLLDQYIGGCKTQIMCKQWYLNSSDQLCLEYLLFKHQTGISHWSSQWKAAPYLGTSESAWLFLTWMHLSEVLTKASQFPATILLCIVISSSSNNNSCSHDLDCHFCILPLQWKLLYNCSWWANAINIVMEEKCRNPSSDTSTSPHENFFVLSDLLKSSFFRGQLISAAVVVAGLISVAFLQQFRTDLLFLSQLPN